MTAKPAEEGHRLLNQLVTLDVSTLITKKPPGQGVASRQAPTGEKAPSMETMVQDLADNYRRFSGAGPSDEFKDVSMLAHVQRTQRTQPQHGLLDRVARNGQDLHDIVQRTGSVQSDGSVRINEAKLTPADAATIRKAWELALDPVDLATNVSLEGDVLTRFSTRDGAPPTDDVIAFHGVMVESGLREWDALMGLVAQFVATLASFFLTDSPRRMAHTRTTPRATNPCSPRARSGPTDLKARARTRAARKRREAFRHGRRRRVGPQPANPDPGRRRHRHQSYGGQHR